MIIQELANYKFSLFQWQGNLNDFFFQIESMTFQTIEFNFKINNKKECIMLTIKMPEQFNAVRDTSSIVDSG